MKSVLAERATSRLVAGSVTVAQNPSISLIGWSQAPPISPGRWSPRSGKFPSWVPITYVRVPAVT